MPCHISPDDKRMRFSFSLLFCLIKVESSSTPSLLSVSAEEQCKVEAEKKAEEARIAEEKAKEEARIAEEKATANTRLLEEIRDLLKSK